MGGEERLVPRFAAAHHIRQQQRHAAGAGLGDADAAGLADQHVRAVHVQLHLGGKAHSLHAVQAAQLQGIAHLLVAAAQHRGKVAVGHTHIQVLRHVAHGAAADAAGHEDDVAAGLRQAQGSPCRGPVTALAEGGTHGNAGGQKGIAGDAAADELVGQLLMGNDADIRGTGTHRGAAGIVRGHEAEHRTGAPRLLQRRHHHGGDHVDTDNGIVAAALQRAAQTAGTAGNVAVHRAVAPVHLLVALGGHIARLVEPGIPAVEPGVPLGNEFGCLFGDEAQAVHHVAGRAAALEAVTQGGGYGVVPAAGVTGQDQYAHFALLSAALAFAAAPPGA